MHYICLNSTLSFHLTELGKHLISLLKGTFSSWRLTRHAFLFPSLPSPSETNKQNTDSNFHLLILIVLCSLSNYTGVFPARDLLAQDLCLCGNPSGLRHAYVHHAAVFSEILLPPGGVATEYQEPKADESNCFPVSRNLPSSSAYFPRPPILHPSLPLVLLGFHFIKFGNNPIFVFR